VITCADVDPHIAEAALGLLGGAERARLLAHIESCDSCRAMVDELSGVADSLVLIAPSAEPPAGFERRVAQRLGTRRPRRVAVVGAAAAALVLVLGGFVVGRLVASGGADVRTVAMHTPSGRDVGEAYLYGGQPSWIVVTVADWRGERDYRLRLDYADGRSAEVAGDGAWSTTVDDRNSVTRIALVDDTGKAWCSADV